MMFEGATPGIKFALGENPKRQGYPRPTFFARPGTPSGDIRERAWAWKK